MKILKGDAEILTVEQWFQLAPPKKGLDQWVDGRSALECAHAWCGAAGPAVPTELTKLLASHPDTKNAVVQWAIPEHKVRFDKLRGEPRNADIVAVADHPGGLVAISIEAKADEPFDLPVHKVLEDLVAKIGADKPTNGVARIQHLASSLLPPVADNTSHLRDLRYQLLTGMAGAIAFAIEHRAPRAIFVLHEFTTDRTDDAKHEVNRRDLDIFVARLTSGATRSIDRDKLVGPISVPGRPLFPQAPSLYVGKTIRNVRRASLNTRLNPSAEPGEGPAQVSRSRDAENSG